MKSKTIAFIGLFIFFAALVGLFTAAFLNNAKQTNINTNTNNISTTTTLSISEVAKHNSATDCWMMISGKVYDFTSLVNSHSGGSQEILKDCGQDGSITLSSHAHSGPAINSLQSYYLGNLGQAINPATVQQVNNTVHPTSDREDD